MPDQEHKQYIDGKIHEIEECPECGGAGEINCICGCGNEHETICLGCDGEGYVKK